VIYEPPRDLPRDKTDAGFSGYEPKRVEKDAHVELGASRLRRFVRRWSPEGVRRRLVDICRRFKVWPPVGFVRFGSLRRRRPISRLFGSDRGRPVDRYFIERFLGRNTADICGRVLEIGDDSYTRRYGDDRVTSNEILSVWPGDPSITVVADLSEPNLPIDGPFDCIIFTQTLHCIFDAPAALRSLAGLLRPGGVLLATFPGISQISRYDMDRWGDYWRFTSLSARRLFETSFSTERVSVEAHGNVLAAAAFLYGLAVEDLHPEELDADDPDYELIITVRAVKEQAAP
jgi:SAM-dependent methyltransferase